jgi:hypothetical protein
MEINDAVNLVVSATTCLWIAGVIAQGAVWHDPTGKILRDDGKLSNTGWTLALWSLFWLMIALAYVEFSESELHGLFGEFMFSDFGNLAALAAAFAYCRGDSFKQRELFPLVFLVFMLPLLEWTLSNVIPGPQGRVIAIAPSLVLSALATLAIGWCILVRCGWGSVPFFLTMCVYAFLQVPAYFDHFVLNFNDCKVFPNADCAPFNDARQNFFGGLKWVFYLLAFSKIIIALSFLGYFFSKDHDQQLLRSEQFWPRNDIAVRMDKTYANILKWGAGIVGSIGGGILLASIESPIGMWLQQLLSLRPPP